MAHHSPPKFLAVEFDCPLCGAHSKQMWLDMKKHYPTKTLIDGKELRISQCTSCNKLTFWLDGKVVSFVSGSASFNDPEQPDQIKQD